MNSSFPEDLISTSFDSFSQKIPHNILRQEVGEI